MTELLIAAGIGIGLTFLFYAIHFVREAIIRDVDNHNDNDWSQ